MEKMSIENMSLRQMYQRSLLQRQSIQVNYGKLLAVLAVIILFMFLKFLVWV